MWVQISLTLFIIVAAGYTIYNSLKTMSSRNHGSKNCYPKQRK